MRFGFASVPFLFTCIAATFSAACGADSESPISSSAEDRVTPSGDETMARLVVSLPAGVCAPGVVCDKPLAFAPTLTLDGVAITLGSVARVTGGRHTLRLAAVANDVTGSAAQEITLDLAVGTTRTFMLAAAKRACAASGSTVVTAPSFGRVPVLRRAACPSALVANAAALEDYNQATLEGGAVITASTDCAALPAFNSAYHATFTRAGTREQYYYYGDQDACRAVQASLRGPFIDLMYSTSIWVASVDAATSCADLGRLQWFNTPSGGQQFISAQPLTLRGFAGEPTRPFAEACELARTRVGRSTESGWVAALPGSLTFYTSPTTSVIKTLGEGEMTSFSFDQPVVGTVPGTFATVVDVATRELPTAAGAPASQIAAPAGCGNSFDLTRAAGRQTLTAYVFPECAYTIAVGGRTAPISQSGSSLHVGRADIDDVVVRREDGTTFTARGTYEVWQSGTRVVGPFPTNTGVDLFAGVYEVRVTYATLVGTKVDAYPLTVH